MALSADTPRTYELGEINTLPVKGSATIYEGAAVGMASGYARGLVAGDAFAGFAQRLADNSGSATDGNINVQVVSKGKAQLTITGIAVTDIGKCVYASADGTFTLTEGSNSPIGVVYRFVTTDTCVVAFQMPSTDKGVPGDITLADGTIIVGNGSNVGAAVTMSGDVTITNTGATEIGNNKVLAAMVSNLSLTTNKLTSAALSELVSYGKSFVTSHVASSAH